MSRLGAAPTGERRGLGRGGWRLEHGDAAACRSACSRRCGVRPLLPCDGSRGVTGDGPPRASGTLAAAVCDGAPRPTG